MSAIETIDQIYQTVEVPEKWPQTLHSIALELRSVGGLIMILLPNQARIAIPSPGLEAAARDYSENWAARDIRSNRLEHRRLPLSLDTIADEDVVSEEEMETDPFYRDFLARHDLKYFCATVWAPAEDTSVGLSIQRSATQGAFTQDDRSKILMFGRHIERALRLRGQLTYGQERAASLERLLDCHGQAVVLVYPDGRVYFASKAVKALPASLVSVRADRLRFGRDIDGESVLVQMRAVAEGNIDAATKTLFSSHDSDASGFALSIMRHPGSPSDELDRSADLRSLVMLMFSPIRRDARFDVAVVRDFLKVSMGEARIAVFLASGKSTADAAKTMGLTEGTVRFVLKQIYRKTGFRGKTELISTLHALRGLPMTGNTAATAQHSNERKA